jgi:hypothetical protein
MQHVLECGADYGSNEHDIATQLFVKKDQREIFLSFQLTKLGSIGLPGGTMISMGVSRCLMYP